MKRLPTQLRKHFATSRDVHQSCESANSTADTAGQRIVAQVQEPEIAVRAHETRKSTRGIASAYPSRVLFNNATSTECGQIPCFDAERSRVRSTSGRHSSYPVLFYCLSSSASVRGRFEIAMQLTTIRSSPQCCLGWCRSGHYRRRQDICARSHDSIRNAT